MYSSVFWKLYNIIREKTLLQDTRFISVKEMLASFLLIVGQNSQYCVVRKTFGRDLEGIKHNCSGYDGQTWINGARKN